MFFFEDRSFNNIKAFFGKLSDKRLNHKADADGKVPKEKRPVIRAKVEIKAEAEKVARESETDRWVYSNKKGVQVFAIYSLSDINDPTILYAVSGKEVDSIKNSAVKMFGGDEYDGRKQYDNDGRSFDYFLESIDRKETNKVFRNHSGEERGTTTGDGRLPGEARKSGKTDNRRDG